MSLNISAQENKVISNLIEQGLFTKQQLEELSLNQLNKLKNIKDGLFNKIYSLDLINKKINVMDNKLSIISQIDLSGENKSPLKSEDLTEWSNSTVIFNNENKKAGDFFWKDFEPVFIAFSKDKAYMYNSNIENENYLSCINSYISGANTKNKSDSGVFDLFFFLEKNIVIASDRSAGNIHIINFSENKLIKTFDVRTRGINKAINVTLSTKKNKLFVTDNISTNITVISLDDFTTTNLNPGIGVLGNLIISPDQESLYCITLKPKESLKLIDINNLSLKKEFSLKGNFFSLGDIPYDLLEISPDKKFVYFMTHIPDPDPFTPVITVIETDKEKAVQRFSIKDGTKITNIGFAEINPLYSEKKDIFNLLVLNKLVDHDKISSVQKQIEEDETNAKFMKEFEFNSQPNIMETLPGMNNFTVQQKEGEKKKEDIQWEINLVPQKIEFCNITPGLDSILYKKCREKLMKDFEIRINELAEKEKWEKAETEKNKRFKEFDAKLNNKDAMITIRLNDAITKARQELEWHDLTIIRLIELLDNYNFEMSFTREDALEWIRQKERDELIETGLKTVATNCPNCDAQLLGSYSCRVCGFELEKPEEMMKRKLLQISTYHPLENLRQGHLIITDTINHKVIETDHFRRIIYELKKDVLSDIQVDLEIPRDAVRLKNNITLVADYGSNRVFKLTQKGKKYWELDYEYNPENKLNKPISIAALESGNIIIVDYGNHRVIEVNEDHEVVWRYGKKGIEGIDDGHLRFPTFFQRTKGATNIITDSMNHRVIEVENNKIIWQYGNENNVEDDSAKGNGVNQLDTPLTAWRYENGNTLILDSGNHRVIEVNPQKEIIWEYQTNKNSSETDLPIKAFRLRTGKIMVVGEKKVIEVDHSTKEISWSSSIDELTNAASDSDINTVSENVKKTKVFHGMKNPYAKQIISEKSEDERIKSYMDAKKSEMANRMISRSPVLLAPNAKVLEKDFIVIDKNNAEINVVDRKGNKKYQIHNDKIIKPQFACYSKNNSIFVSDSEAKTVSEIELESNNILWSYKNNDLINPKGIDLTDSGTILVTDQSGGKVFELNKNDSSVIWEYKNHDLRTPYFASRLNNGNTLITDWAAHYVYEVNSKNDIVWSYGIIKKSGNEENMLYYPEHAIRLENGNTLITDTRNARVIEVSPDKKIIWSFDVDGINKLMSPNYSIRLEDGNTAIIHSNYKQILEVNKNSKFVWKFIYQERRV